MKFLSLVVWVTQFGFSVLFPTCFFLLLAWWLMTRFGIGLWVVAVLGILGFLTSLSTARSCVRSLLKEISRQSGRQTPPTAFNDHT